MVKNFCGRGEREDFAGENIVKIGSHLKGVRPKGRGHRCMVKKCASGVINSTNFAFSFTILRRSVRTRETKIHVMFRTLVVEGRVIKFTTIVTLKAFYFTFKLSVDVVTKSNESGHNLRFFSERKSP